MLLSMRRIGIFGYLKKHSRTDVGIRVCRPLDGSCTVNSYGIRSLIASTHAIPEQDICLLKSVDRIRNVAIIAHVDHGKTTLVDCLLRQSDIGNDFGENVEPNALEKERGITILSKAASVPFRDFHINIVDTPGHSDFGGEVERVLSMVDGVILVVDATEGVMTQTKFVLAKALKQNLSPIVVLNKSDRPTCRIDEVNNEILELFLNLDASEQQLDYPTLYASAKDGWAVSNFHKDERKNMSPLFDSIIQHVPPPKVVRDAPFSMLVTQLEYDPFVGKCLIGRIQSGVVSNGLKIGAINQQANVVEKGRVTKLFARRGLNKEVVEYAGAGDIVSLAGFSNATVNSTIIEDVALEGALPLKPVPIDPPTITILFSVNDSPFKGNEGTKLTSSLIKERLHFEAETNVSLRVFPSVRNDSFEVQGRGELQLGILLETMRREGFELSISSPKVIMRKNDVTQQLEEPYEEVFIEVPDEYTGSIIEKLSKRRADLKNYTSSSGTTRLSFEIPSRGLLGFFSEFKNDTSGKGVLANSFLGYRAFKGDMEKSRKGSLISMAEGVATAHALHSLESRGTLFIKPGDKIYAGMVVGEHNKDMDIEVNPVRMKHVTNVRSVARDDTVKLSPVKQMLLENSLSYINDDEIVEVTPKTVRIRKAKGCKK